MNSLLINIDVPDIEKAISFYTSALPLKLGRKFDEEFVELLGMPTPIYLLKKNAGTLPAPGSNLPRTYDRHWCPIHLDFVIENIEETRKKLLAAGAREESPVSEEPYGKLGMYRDIFGHGICLIQFNQSGYNVYLK